MTSRVSLRDTPIDLATVGQRVASATAIIQKALAKRKRPYVAFSGGKDSMVVLALVQQIGGDIPVLWSDDELEYPELIELMAPMAGQPDLTIALGWATHAGWFAPWRDRPFWRDPLPGAIRIDMDADDYMATRGHDLVFTGVRAEENNRRREWLESSGPLYRVRSGVRMRCCPLWDWSVEDVWAYTRLHGLPVCGSYDVLERIGVPLKSRRVGPLPLAREYELREGWPQMYERLVARYGRRWS